MPYSSVPQRLRDGEFVPRSEIIAYWGPGSNLRITLALEVLRSSGIMEKSYTDETVKFGLTSLGLSIRLDLITRLEGDCPDCPECP